jgi:glycosyltransferase involved in cell wall biosynthesis
MRVLAVSYFFPPIGGAGVQRNLRLVSHLSGLGVDVTVLTGPGNTTSFWAPRDDGLSGETPREIEVNRLSRADPSVTSFRGRAERILRIDSQWTRWWRDGIRTEGPPLARGCDLVWALMQPYASAHPVGKLAAAFNLPWIADLADPWALDEMQIYPSALHRTLARREMSRVLRSSAGIVMSTPEAASRLVQVFPELASHPIAIGPVGWDRRDFATPLSPRSDEVFRIVHTGYLHTELGRKQRRSAGIRRLLGGSQAGVEILTRSHVYLLQAVDELLEQRPELRGRVEIQLAGVQSAADREVSAKNVAVRMLGYVEHPQAVSLIRSADLLFLPMHDLPPGQRATIVPGKTYEYLASGRPILAAVPDGDARDILSEAGSAFICRPTDVERMRAIVSSRVDAYLAGEQFPGPDPRVVGRYEYNRLARELSSFFEAVVAG